MLSPAALAATADVLTTERVIALYPAGPDRPLGYGEFWAPHRERDRDEWLLLWRRIIARDGKRCWYCKRRQFTLTLDHVVPKARGGSDHLSNLRAACVECNEAKADVLPSPVGTHECQYPAANLTDGLCLVCSTPRSKQSRKVAALVEARRAAGPHECRYEPPDDPDGLCAVCATGLSKGARKRLNRRLRAR